MQPRPRQFTADGRYGVGDLPRFTTELPAGDGHDLVEQRCTLCHSTAYIMGQPPLDEALWTKEVKKMVDGYGAAISEAEIPQIVSYLTQHLSEATRHEPVDTPDSAGGATAYLQNCVMCHQAAGQGVPGAFPPLAGGHVLKLAQSPGGRAYLINLLLYGVTGPVDIGGGSYNNIMPPLGNRITDQQVADILNYVLTAWSPAPGIAPIQPAEVTPWRAKIRTPQENYRERPKL